MSDERVWFNSCWIVTSIHSNRLSNVLPSLLINSTKSIESTQFERPTILLKIHFFFLLNDYYENLMKFFQKYRLVTTFISSLKLSEKFQPVFVSVQFTLAFDDYSAKNSKAIKKEEEKKVHKQRKSTQKYKLPMYINHHIENITWVKKISLKMDHD